MSGVGCPVSPTGIWVYAIGTVLLVRYSIVMSRHCCSVQFSLMSCYSGIFSGVML